MNKRCLQLLAIILVMASPLIVAAQQSSASASAEILTLDQAISLALHDNRQVQERSTGNRQSGRSVGSSANLSPSEI